ncbi:MULTISPECIES: ABC transporter permease [Paenibacillus]|uniref:ABC transporter permease n=1 Tax=Paenibacillus campinasensis TaxID=66347 RepID=A0A268ETN6_9BACL|nr:MULTISPECIES: ABC transporter permease [Paenibacillus]MUG67139.1 ABC transporter permease [Paenibacillus campinasensis]PAD76434.1 sugar ABC transporter permease [Paenibacillus campinasensis]PAK54975.1 sugar ABC transporter permease [Paenibacillus sp. 7541]
MAQLFDLALINSALRVLTPILLAALGGALCSRVGLFNVGLEGFMLLGAFSAVAGNYFFGNVVYAIVFAIIVVSLFSLVFGYLSIHLKANVIVVGVAMNALAAGITTFSLRAIFDVKGAFYDNTMVGLPKWNIPIIENIPVLGPILAGLTPLVYVAFLIAGLMWYYFYRTKSGFRFLAAGENPLAARSVGIRVTRYQYGAVLASGVLCALGGAQLSLGQVTMFTEGMTAGRGFIALVATMLGQSGPLGVTAASLLFGFMDALSIRFQGLALPTHFTQMLPYVVTILAMFFFKDKSFQQDALKQGTSSR